MKSNAIRILSGHSMLESIVFNPEDDHQDLLFFSIFSKRKRENYETHGTKLDLILIAFERSMLRKI
ncbi:CLUMA_CG018442, isoform A [Clunio marinus]|uniref:CLUMA_CG018442, isoform A n=1 Tax=Clunio marinus TaxID=568069 RepID=A0A1J1J263_9DIPT|nr:CLUMA_CG018442, isoform A [Clunio marinus]